MGEWNRTTKEITLEKIRPEINAAIQDHLAEFKLGSIMDDCQLCIETFSEKRKKRLFAGSGDMWTITVAVVTPAWLINAGMGEKQAAFAMTVLRSEMQAEDYALSPGYKVMPDNGVWIRGDFTGMVGMHGNQRVTVFIPLGQESVCRQFKDLLTDD
jgi:hypothetical protein